MTLGPQGSPLARRVMLTGTRIIWRAGAQRLTPPEALQADRIGRRLWPGLVPVPPASKSRSTEWRRLRERRAYRLALLRWDGLWP